MTFLALPAGALIVVITLFDGFETMVLPRRVARSVKLTRYYYGATWAAWSRVSDHLPASRREGFLGVYGPLSLILLFAVWAVLLIGGFSLVYTGLDFTPIGEQSPARWGTALYYSGTTFFTLGLGDVSSGSAWVRAASVLEAGTGFGFLALVIGYLPVLYQAFSRREVSISLLDARAGSPPTAGALFMRFPPAGHRVEIDSMMRSWETWCAELLESHLSYPLLAYFRSQHDRQSWLAALTAMLDAGAMLAATDGTTAGSPSQLMFAMARHAAVDLAQVLSVGSAPANLPDRLPPARFARLLEVVPWPPGDEAVSRFNQIRATYEPVVAALSAHLRMPLPPWLPDPATRDDWQTSEDR